MRKTPGKGFVVGLLFGLVFVAFKLFKYSGGGTRNDLPLYMAAILCFGILGATGAFLIAWIVRIFRKR